MPHTPGPWSIRSAPNGDWGVSAEGTGIFAESFADIRFAGESARDEASANARLIAAAPDMEAALAAAPILGQFDSTEDFITACVIWIDKHKLPALRKARGETVQ